MPKQKNLSNVLYSLELQKRKRAPKSESEVIKSETSRKADTTVTNNIGSGDDDTHEEKVIAQVIRELLKDQNLMASLLEFFAQFNGPPTDNPPRDISKNEIIRPRDLPQTLGISKTTCWRLSKDPASGFPKKIRLSSGACGFLRAELEAWRESKREV